MDTIQKLHNSRIITLTFIALFILVLGCGLKSARKNLSEVSKGDSKQTVLELFGKPDRVQPFNGSWGEWQLWTYNCAQFGDCDSNCVFITPCYYVYFENDRLISIYDAVIW